MVLGISMWDRAAIKIFTFKIGDEYLVVLLIWIRQLQRKQQVPFLFVTYIGILKLHSLFISCHHPFHCCFSSSLTVFFPSFNVFAKGRLRSESRQEDHVIRLWKYVCWNCISTKKKGSRKKAKQPCFIQLCWRKLRFSLDLFYRISNCEWRLGKNSNISKCGMKWFNPNGFLP